MRIGGRGTIPEGVFRLPDGRVVTIEVKRVMVDGWFDTAPRDVRGRRWITRFPSALVIESGLCKVSRSLIDTIRRETGLEVRRHVLVLALPLSMTARRPPCAHPGRALPVPPVAHLTSPPTPPLHAVHSTININTATHSLVRG